MTDGRSSSSIYRDRPTCGFATRRTRTRAPRPSHSVLNSVGLASSKDRGRSSIAAFYGRSAARQPARPRWARRSPRGGAGTAWRRWDRVSVRNPHDVDTQAPNEEIGPSVRRMERRPTVRLARPRRARRVGRRAWAGRRAFRGRGCGGDVDSCRIGSVSGGTQGAIRRATIGTGSSVRHDVLASRCSVAGLAAEPGRGVDVAIIGGLMGLWTALALIEIDPAIRVAVLETEHVGFGASARNGGSARTAWPTGWRTAATSRPRSIRRACESSGPADGRARYPPRA